MPPSFGVSFNETDLSAQSYKTSPPAWLPREDEDPSGPKHSKEAQSERAETPSRDNAVKIRATGDGVTTGIPPTEAKGLLEGSRKV